MPLPLLPLALSGISFLGGALNNRARQTTSTTTQALSPEAQGLNTLLMDTIRQRLAGSADLSGYRTQETQNINRTFGNAQTALNADLTARGLSDSPVAGAAISRFQGARAGSIAQLVNSLPLLQRDMQQQDLGLGSHLMALQPRTTTTTGTQPGNMLGGGFSDLGSMLGYLVGQGQFGGAGGAGPTVGRRAWAPGITPWRPPSPGLVG